MAASYPNTIKTFTTKTDNIDDVMAVDVNGLQDETVAIETELGTLPKGAHATVKARLEAHVHSGGDGGQVDHNTTANLTVGDVHTQYHNDTRGDARYAPIAKGVTNGDSHDHNGGDGAQINHTTLSNVGTNTHAQIDTHLAAAAPHTGHAIIVWKDSCVNVLHLDAESSFIDWTDLDLTTSTSANAKLAMIQVTVFGYYGTSGNNFFRIRKNGTTETDVYLYIPYNQTIWVPMIATFIIGLDAGQIMEYRFDPASGSPAIYVDIRVLGYIE